MLSVSCGGWCRIFELAGLSLFLISEVPLYLCHAAGAAGCSSLLVREHMCVRQTFIIEAIVRLLLKAQKPRN